MTNQKDNGQLLQQQAKSAIFENTGKSESWSTTTTLMARSTPAQKGIKSIILQHYKSASTDNKAPPCDTLWHYIMNTRAIKGKSKGRGIAKCYQNA